MQPLCHQSLFLSPPGPAGDSSLTCQCKVAQPLQLHVLSGPEHICMAGSQLLAPTRLCCPGGRWERLGTDGQLGSCGLGAGVEASILAWDRRTGVAILSSRIRRVLLPIDAVVTGFLCWLPSPLQVPPGIPNPTTDRLPSNLFLRVPNMLSPLKIRCCLVSNKEASGRGEELAQGQLYLACGRRNKRMDAYRTPTV